MKTIQLIALALFSITLSNCTNKMTKSSGLKPEKLTPNSHYIVPLDATLRSNLIWTDSTGQFHVLSEVSPDAAVTNVTNLTSKLTASLSGGEKLSAEQVTQISQNLTQLGQRTVAVSILRDALYRLEEFNINAGGKPMDSLTYSLFMHILDNANQIAQAELKKEETKQEEVKLKQEKALVEQKELKLKELTLTQQIDSRSALAKHYEKEGFKALINDDFESALDNFNKAEETYPTFRSVYEIANLIRRNKKELSQADSKTIKRVSKKIMKEYMVPDEFEDKLKAKAK